MKNIKIVILLCFTASSFSCKKYLDAKPDVTLATPSSLRDLQGLLDYYGTMNSQFTAGAEIFADSYYLTSESWSSIYRQDQRNYYIWQKEDKNNQDWNQPYTNIYTCNLVLETLPTISYPPTEQMLSENIKGTALFFRASYFYGLLQLFAKGYDKNTARTDLGIVLRLSTDFKLKSTRATVEQSYSQVISDLKDAIKLLPVNSLLKSRPVKAAVYGSLARTYLAMQDYVNAGLYADSCLSLYNVLMDYNSLDSNSANPISRFNDEVIFQAISQSVDPIAPYKCNIDSTLYRSYAVNDLRKVIYFKDNGDSTYSFKGDYDGGSQNYGHSFTGIVTDEQYLIKAECDARLEKPDDGLKFLNELLVKRYSAANFIPVATTDSVELLTIILTERRKELLFRATRWTDLKRLNKDSRFAVSLTRKLNGAIYQLPPNDVRYVALLPKTVINMTGMQQNP